MVLSPAPAFAADRIGALAAEVNAAYHAHRYTAMEADVDQLLKLLPGFPQGVYFLAIARAGEGDAEGALRTLDRLAGMGLHFDIRKQAVLKGLQDEPGFHAIERRFATNLKQVGAAVPAFRLAAPDFIPEGIAHDPVSGDFFVASVHLRKIVRIHHGRASTFADQRSGLDSVLGIRVDARHHAVWATSAAMAQTSGYDPKMKGRTALFRFDSSGALQAKYPLPPHADHSLNDLDVAPDGTVYVADGNGGVYLLKPDGSRLEPLTADGAVHSAQGLAVSPDGQRLYVADYEGGLFAVDPATGKLTRLTAPSDVCVHGIDGLIAVDGDLVATQNGIRPQRIIRYRLDGEGLAIESAQVLDANDALVSEPTLLTVVNDTLYVVANSQWSRFDEAGNLPADGSLQAPVIAKLPLD
jgi:sugar lactone lactonase YvrE